MSNATTPPNRSINMMTNKSEITKNEKIIIGVLLFIMCLLLITIGEKTLQNMIGLPVEHGNIMVGGDRYHRFFGSDSIQYIFSLEQSKKTNTKLFGSLPQSAELSPDGQWIVFGTRDHSIYIMRTDGTQQTLVPILYGGDVPTWAPDGNQIALFGYIQGAGIYTANIKCLLHGESCTPAFRLLVKAPVGYKLTSLDWSPDGTKIAYTGPAQSRISVIYVDGQSPPAQIPHRSYAFDGRISNPQYSPDGTKIVAICHGPISGVCVMNRDGTDIVYLKQDTRGKYASQPRWSPDGQLIAFISTPLNYQFSQSCFPDGCSTILRPSSVHIMTADGNAVTSLPFEDNVVTKWFFWYP